MHFTKLHLTLLFLKTSSPAFPKLLALGILHKKLSKLAKSPAKRPHMTEPSRSYCTSTIPVLASAPLFTSAKGKHTSRITCAGRNALHTPTNTTLFLSYKGKWLLALTVNLQWLFDHELKTQHKNCLTKSHGVIKTRMYLLLTVSKFGTWMLYTIQSVHLKACNQDVNMQLHTRLNRIVWPLFCIVQKVCRAGFQKLQCFDSDRIITTIVCYWMQSLVFCPRH